MVVKHFSIFRNQKLTNLRYMEIHFLYFCTVLNIVFLWLQEAESTTCVIQKSTCATPTHARTTAHADAKRVATLASVSQASLVRNSI